MPTPQDAAPEAPLGGLEPEATVPTRVGLLVDYPVLMRAVRGADPDAVPRLGEILSRARTLGPVVVSRAYGAWYDVDEGRDLERLCAELSKSPEMAPRCADVLRDLGLLRADP